jgi:hypothetical protein
MTKNISESEVDVQDARDRLLSRIRRRSAGIDEFLGRTRPRSTRLGWISVVCSSASAALMAGPAVGGDAFSGSVQAALQLPEESWVWQILCVGALVISIISAIATNLLRSDDLISRISATEATKAELEGLEALLEFGSIRVDAAVELYQQYVTKVPYVDDDPIMQSTENLAQ